MISLRPPSITRLVIRRSTRSLRAGLTLLELFIALAILGVVSLGLVSSITTADRLRFFSRERAAAGLAATGQLEDVLATRWDDLLARSGESFPVAVESEVGTWQLTPLEGEPGPGRVTVGDATRPDLRQVQVTVRWRSRAGGEGVVTLRTLIARH